MNPATGTTRATAALVAIVAAATLVACGDTEATTGLGNDGLPAEPDPGGVLSDIDGGLTQEETLEVLLTHAEFPLEGFVPGTVTEGPSSVSAVGGDVLTDFPGIDDLAPECRGLLEASSDLDIRTQSTSGFVADDHVGQLARPEIDVSVATFGGTDLLHSLDALATTCDDHVIDEDGLTATLSFEPLQADAQGVRIAVEVMGEEVDVVLAGRTDGPKAVMVTGLAVSEEDVLQVLDAQQAKLTDR